MKVFKGIIERRNFLPNKILNIIAFCENKLTYLRKNRC